MVGLRQSDSKANGWITSYLLLILVNFLLITFIGQVAVTYMMFPFSTWLVKRQHLNMMNRRLCEDIAQTFEQANSLIQKRMNRQDYMMYENYRDFKKDTTTLRRMCDYAQVFSEANKQLVLKDQDKRRRHKKTRRNYGSPLLAEVEDCLSQIVKTLKSLEVVSIGH